MSLLLRPDMPIENAIKITTSAAAAVAEAVEKISGEPTYIKWVNDIYQRRRKICGILSESASDIEHGGLQYVILGIGINVYQPRDGFPDDIKTKAGGIFENRQADMRSILAAEVVSCFHEYYKNLEKNTFFEQYKKRMIWIGQKIYIYSPSGEIGSAVLTGLNSDCSLALCYPDGTTGTVTSGEISINRLSCEKSYEEKNLE
jgi:BirA family biotin operon repressor/biotin-[acetyl-CoA-carboxylase] ligase